VAYTSADALYFVSFYFMLTHQYSVYLNVTAFWAFAVTDMFDC